MSTFTRRSAPVLALAALAGAAGLGCSGSTPSSSESTTTAAPATSAPAAGAPVVVTMKEWTVEPTATQAKPGPVTFEAKNAGTKVHEVALLKSDLAPDRLPLDEDGAVDESGEGVELVDEVEDVDVGESKSFTTDLAAGNYYLVCNLVDADTGDKHFGHKMFASFTVS